MTAFDFFERCTRLDRWLDEPVADGLSRRRFLALLGLTTTAAACDVLLGPEPVQPTIALTVDPEELYGRDTVEVTVSGEPGTEGSSITSVVINGQEAQGASSVLEELLENPGASPSVVSYEGVVHQSDGLTASDTRDVVVNPARPPNLDAVVASPSTVYGGGQVNLAGDVSADVFMERVSVDEDDDGSVEATYQNADDSAVQELSHSLALENEGSEDLEKRVNVHAVDEWGNSNERVFNIIVKPYVRGVVSDIFSGAVVSGGVVTHDGVEHDIGSDGSYKLGIADDPASAVSLDVPGYAPRDTYLAHRTDGGFVLIPAEYIDDVREIVWLAPTTETYPEPNQPWDTSLTPEIIINPTGLPDALLNDIETGVFNYILPLTDGHVANATAVTYDENFYDDKPPAGVIGFYKVDDRNGTRRNLEGNKIIANTIYLKPNATFFTVIHELGHAFGHGGHYPPLVESVMNPAYTLGEGEQIYPLDQRNATVIFTMPAGSEYEDNRQVDPAP